MTEQRDPLLDAIHAAGEVPPPPDRDAAFARAMQPVLLTSRRRVGRSVIALFAAALIAAPAAVFAARATHTPAAVLAPIVKETADPDPPIQQELDDSAARRSVEHATENEPTQGSDDHSGTGSSGSTETQQVSGDDSSSTSGRDGSSSGSGDVATPTPTPTQTESGSSGSIDGGTLSGDSGSSSSGSGPSPDGSSSPSPDGSSSPSPH